MLVLSLLRQSLTNPLQSLEPQLPQPSRAGIFAQGVSCSKRSMAHETQCPSFSGHSDAYSEDNPFESSALRQCNTAPLAERISILERTIRRLQESAAGSVQEPRWRGRKRNRHGKALSPSLSSSPEETVSSRLTCLSKPRIVDTSKMLWAPADDAKHHGQDIPHKQPAPILAYSVGHVPAHPNGWRAQHRLDDVDTFQLHRQFLDAGGLNPTLQQGARQKCQRIHVNEMNNPIIVDDDSRHSIDEERCLSETLPPQTWQSAAVPCVYRDTGSCETREHAPHQTGIARYKANESVHQAHKPLSVQPMANCTSPPSMTAKRRTLAPPPRNLPPPSSSPTFLELGMHPLCRVRASELRGFWRPYRLA